MKTFVFIIVVLNIVLSISAIVLILLLDRKRNKKLDKIKNLVNYRENYVTNKKDIINSESFFMNINDISKGEVVQIIDILEKSQENMSCDDVDKLYKFYKNKLYNDDYKNITFPKAILFEYLEDLFDVSYVCNICDDEFNGLIHIIYKQLPNIPLKNLGENPVDKLDECEGDCDYDTDCLGDLKCFERSGNEEVPGCISGGGGDISGYDYCVRTFKSLEDYPPTIFSHDGKYFVLNLHIDPNDDYDSTSRNRFTKGPNLEDNPIGVYHMDHFIEYKLTLDQYKQLIRAYIYDRMKNLEELYCSKSCSGIASIVCSS